jgi:hypothetical protein
MTIQPTTVAFRHVWHPRSPGTRKRACTAICISASWVRLVTFAELPYRTPVEMEHRETRRGSSKQLSESMKMGAGR